MRKHKLFKKITALVLGSAMAVGIMSSGAMSLTARAAATDAKNITVTKAGTGWTDVTAEDESGTTLSIDTDGKVDLTSSPTSVILTAIPDTDYRITGWTGAEANETNPAKTKPIAIDTTVGTDITVTPTVVQEVVFNPTVKAEDDSSTATNITSDANITVMNGNDELTP